MTDMPPRLESELDHYTLHNMAITTATYDPHAHDAAKCINDAVKKLQFLLQQPSFPEETFSNLLLIYVKYEHYDLAADVMAANPGLVKNYLSSVCLFTT